MKWRERWRRLRIRLKGARNGWRAPEPLRWPVRRSAAWSDDVNFALDQSVLRILIPVGRELLRDEAQSVPAMVAEEAHKMALAATEERVRRA